MLLEVGMDRLGNEAKQSRKGTCKMKEEDDDHTSLDRRERASHACSVLERRRPRMVCSKEGLKPG